MDTMDMIVNSIKRGYRSDLYRAMKDMTVEKMINPPHEIRLPLTAEAWLLYENADMPRMDCLGFVYGNVYCYLFKVILPRKVNKEESRMVTTIAQYLCLRCSYRYIGRPGPTECLKCQNLYIKWLNYGANEQ